MNSTLAPTKQELEDLLWRGVWTFIATFSGVLTAIPVADFLGVHVAVSAVYLALASGIASVISMLKTYASNKLGTGTAAKAAVIDATAAVVAGAPKS